MTAPRGRHPAGSRAGVPGSARRVDGPNTRQPSVDPARQGMSQTALPSNGHINQPATMPVPGLGGLDSPETGNAWRRTQAAQTKETTMTLSPMSTPG
jgi:hypothetical protein